MQALHHLIRSMSPSELRMFRASITTGAFRSEAETKTRKLFEYLKECKEAPGSEACCQEVYGNPKDKRFKMLKLRLKGKLLDSLLNDINIERQSAQLDEYDHAGIKIRKKLAQFHQLYYTKGNQPLTMQLLDEVISLSKKWEYYIGLVDGLRIKKLRTGFSKGEKEYNRLNEEIKFYEACYQYLNDALDMYYRLMMKSSFQGHQDGASIQEFYLQCISYLKNYHFKTNSANIGYYLGFFEIGYYQNEQDYNKAREVCMRLLQMLDKNPSANRKLRVGSTYLNLGQCDIWLNDYPSAVSHVRKAQDYFPSHGVNYAVAKEQEFLALLYGNNLKEAEQVSAELLRTTTAGAQGDFRLAKYEFYRANSLFKKKEFKEAMKILGRKHELSKDKIGWEIAIRVLTIMTQVELERYDEASLQIEGLRKHMDRHSKLKELRERDRLILKTLQEMEKNGYVSGQIKAGEAKLLEKLKSTDPKLRWEPVTPELVPFHEWMGARYKPKRGGS